MAVDTEKQTREFQTEVRQLLDLMIHSLYSNKEIFLRELISNASDAADKLKFEALTNSDLYGDDHELKIRVAYDEKKKTITISDNGIGMSQEEVIENLGTIAKSGTKAFLESLTGDQAKDSQLIGQFGVGFYSSYIVADNVTVVTRRAGLAEDQAVKWESDGKGEYTIESTNKASRGTEVTLHLKKDEKEFLDNWKLRTIITKYSDHISLPIIMKSVPMPGPDGEAPAEEPQDETVNKASALWTRPKKEIKSEDYEEFYKHIGHDFEGPLAYTHNQLEGKLTYTTLLFIPKRAPFDLWDRDNKHGLKLYIRRVFIMDDAENLMPRYLRFVKGIVDSDDLPLNISREILQQNAVVDKIRGASVKKVLGLLEKMAEKEPEKYTEFWNTFGRVLKEGPGEDFGNKEKIAKLLRFASTYTDSDEQNVSLDDYISRMKEGQDKIYYIATDSFDSAKNSPHLEIFRKKGVEVLLMSDPVDQWLASHLTEYDEKKFQSVAKGELDLGELEDQAEKEELEKSTEEHKDFLEKLKETLDEKVKEVRVTHRLTESPSCLVVGEYDMAVPLQRMLKNAGQGFPQGKPIMEINPEHFMVKMAEKSLDDSEQLSTIANLLFDQAMLVEGGQLDDPATFVRQMNKLLAKAAVGNG